MGVPIPIYLKAFDIMAARQYDTYSIKLDITIQCSYRNGLEYTDASPHAHDDRRRKKAK